MIPRVGNSPQLYARMGGVLYLLNIVLGFFGEAVRDRFIVSGDAAATAANLVSRESMWRLRIASEFTPLICAIALAMIYFFFLLNPVSKELIAT